jgi:hypothetical protein
VVLVISTWRAFFMRCAGFFYAVRRVFLCGAPGFYVVRRVFM